MAEDGLRELLLDALRRGLLDAFPEVLREPALFGDVVGGRAVDAALAAGWTVQAVGAAAEALVAGAFAYSGGAVTPPRGPTAPRLESHARWRLTALALLLHAPGGRVVWHALEQEHGAGLPCWDSLEELSNLDELRAVYATEIVWTPSLAALARRFGTYGGNGRGDAAETEEP